LFAHAPFSREQRRVSSPPGLKFGRQPLIRTKMLSVATGP